MFQFPVKEFDVNLEKNVHLKKEANLHASVLPNVLVIREGWAQSVVRINTYA